MSSLKIGLVYDLRSQYLAEGFSDAEVAEFDFDETIEALEQAVAATGHRTDRIGHARSLVARLVAGDRWDMVFNIAEGIKGRSREAQVPAMLDLYGIPYTFSDPLVSALTLDKAMTKRILRDAGLPTAPFAVVVEPADIEKVRLAYPLFAKPVAEGTSKGVDTNSRVENIEELRATCNRLLQTFHQPVLVEEFLPGREFTTGILGTGASARAIGTMEFRIKDPKYKGIYSYETKENCESLVEYFAPPRDAVRTAVEELALASFRTLECRDAGRVDIRLDAAGRPTFIEVNPMPGLHPTHSDLPMIATQEGIGYRELIATILIGAARRAGLLP